MFSSLFRGLGKLALFLATLAFLVVMTLFVAGSFILTWPLHRLSPRDRRIKATMDLAQSGMAWVTIFSEGNLRKMMTEALNETEPGQADGNEPVMLALFEYGRHWLNCDYLKDNTADCSCGWKQRAEEFGLEAGPIHDSKD